MLTQPDLTNGILKEKDGKCLFLRLWPDPVFLSETEPGVWAEVQDPADDFNSTTLKTHRDNLVQRYKNKYPQLAGILDGGQNLAHLPQ